MTGRRTLRFGDKGSEVAITIDDKTFAWTPPKGYKRPRHRAGSPPRFNALDAVRSFLGAGQVRAVFHTRRGALRFVVEHGHAVLRIYRGEELRPLVPLPPPRYG